MSEFELVRSTESERKSRARLRYNQVMRLVRRAHLYTGLFMTPWVFLYGITALLFNHPEAFPDQPIRSFDATMLSGTKLGSVPAPESLASEVIASLNAQNDRPGKGPRYRLVRPAEAIYTRQLQATARGGGRQYIVRFDLDSKQGSIREVSEPPGPARAPFARQDARPLDPPPLSDLKEMIPALLSRLDVNAFDVVVRSNPELSFLLDGGDGTWRVQYDLAAGTISGRPEDAPGEPLSSRRFLTRLHMTHGYPSRLEARWFWAIAVDLMFVSMVGWGTTGLLMWWQMKNVRRVGIVVVTVSLVVATTVAIGMHDAIQSQPGVARTDSPKLEKFRGSRKARTDLPNPEGDPLPKS
jgi:hypothetical protein